VALFFLPLALAALLLPVRWMLAVAALNFAAYLGLLPYSHDASLGGVLIVAAALALTTWVCTHQAAIRQRQRRELARISRTDLLTGALNRSGFEERFNAELARAQRTSGEMSLLMIDIENLWLVNQRQGHQAGDQLLAWAAETIANELRASVAVGRWGGDEFAVMLTTGESSPVVDRLLTRLTARIGVHAGIASYPFDGSDAAELFRRADETVRESKQGPRVDTEAPKRDLSWATDLANAVDARMGVAHTHSNAVSQLAAGVARELEWEEPALGMLRLAAELHDIGKIVVPVHILRKPGRLSDAEWGEMRKHAEAGAEIAARVEGLEVIVPWIRHSHERIDGRGYPDQLQGEQIPLASRIILVADAYDAMTSDRPYRAAMTREEAFTELRRHAGTQFDTRCVDALMAHLSPRGAVEAGPANGSGSGKRTVRSSGS